MRIHIVGVAGTGMGSLAGLLGDLGHEVTGSDVRFDPPMGPLLQDWGVTARVGFKAEHLEPAPDLVIVGNVCRPDNIEAITAQERGLPYTHIAGALQRFALEGRAVAVCAGTHGKTTTSSMVAWLLDAAGKQPGFFVGGVPNNFGRGFRAAAVGQPFVIEGDEYDTSFFEKTAKFLHYFPRHAIVTSVEHDHIDIYPTEESYVAAFRRFVSLLPSEGVLVAHAGDPQLVSLLTEARASVVSYAVDGFSAPLMPPTWRASAVRVTSEGSQLFEVSKSGKSLGTARLPASGLHNVGNALAAIALCHDGYGIPVDQLLDNLAGFLGTRRRQELLGAPGGVRVYDDFAHHPSAVATTLRGLRARHAQGKLIAVFEPRSATACRNRHQTQYAAAFDSADVVLLAPLGRSGLPEAERLDTEQIARELRSSGKDAVACLTLNEVERAVVQRATAGDTVALLSNGAFGDLPKHLMQALQ